MTDEIKIENDTVNTDPVLEEVPQKPATIGIVQLCNRLNVRTSPDKDSEVLCIIRKDEEVMVEPVFKHDHWYSIYTSAGIGGYCMKEFIKIM